MTASGLLARHDVEMRCREVIDRVRSSAALTVRGGSTHWEVGNPVAPGVDEVVMPAGVVRHDPADMTATLFAGTTVGDARDALAEHGQFVPFDPADDAATVGGLLSVGLSGIRRLRYGPIRDAVLEVWFIAADGAVVRAGGPTVKNVTGYDLPRLLVGAHGTLGLLAQVTLRCQPLPAGAAWFRSDDDGWNASVRRSVFAPSALLWDGASTSVLLEGTDAEIAAETAGTPLLASVAPDPPAGPHRGRISAAPAAVRVVGQELSEHRIEFCAEIGVGTIHVAAEAADGIARAREIAQRHGGWLLRERGAPDLDGYGMPIPNAELMGKIKARFDPHAKFNPGRFRW